MNSENHTVNLKKVSIIIPCYNVEKYLEDCLSSVVSQTYNNLEIIVINDGSSDSTPKIVDKFSALDSRIIAIHQENRGVSESRNLGIKKSSGEYICFIDSDDKVLPQYIERMVEYINNEQADIICTSMSFLHGNVQTTNPETLPNKKTEFNSPKQYLISLLNNEMDWMTGISACGKLYRKQCIEEISFPQNRVCEDAYILYDYLSHSKKTVIIPESLYIYRKCENSISHSITEKYVLDNLVWKTRLLSIYNKETDNDIIDLLSRKLCYDLLREHKFISDNNKESVKLKYKIARKRVIKSHTLPLKVRLKYFFHPSI